MDDDRTWPQSRERARQNVLRELVSTEEKYVWDLELLQQYVETASASVPYETLRRLFPNLKGILELHRELVARNERMCDLPWQAQRWGAFWIEKEQELFVAYQSWCAQYHAATELLHTIVPDLDPYDHLISSKSELSAFLVKPASRIFKYPLILHDLLKTTRKYEYPWYNEVVEANNALKRLHAQLIDACIQAENSLIAERLRTRVADWKGHDPANFGELIQEDVLEVVRASVPCVYHVFLFENILLCAREVVKRKKPRQPLHRQVVPSKTVTPLVLDGRIFIADIARVVPSSRDGFSLAVWWRDDDDMQQFTLRCRTEDHMDRWHKKIVGLIGGDDSDDGFWCPGE